MDVPLEVATGATLGMGAESEHVVSSLETDEEVLGVDILPEENVELMEIEEAIIAIVT